jgi:hypothetical protein
MYLHAMAEDQDWRVRADLHTQNDHGLVERLVGRTRTTDVAKEAGAELPHDVVITHDGNLLFAYAATEPGLDVARRTIEAVLRSDRIEATVTVSHFDQRFDQWLQVDPPLTGNAKRTEDAKQRDEQKVERRTLVASTGKMIRSEVEQTMRDWTEKLGLELEVHEHPHLLTCQVAFTVTGTRGKVDEFAEGLRAEELATVRTERRVMLSPL